MSMALGGCSGILLNYPYPARWLRDLGLVFYVLAISSFIFSSIITVLRHTSFSDLNQQVWKHPSQSLFLSCSVMAFATIIANTNSYFGSRAVWVCYVLWWINLVLTIVYTWLMIFTGYIYHIRREFEKLNAVILLPVVTFVVQATTGTMIVEHLPHDWQLHMIVVTTLVLGSGELLSYAYTCVYQWRLLTGNLPSREAIISSFLPIGPLGQGSYGIIANARNLEHYLLAHDSERFAILAMFPVLTYIASFLALAMLGYACFWMFMAVVGCLYRRPRIFTMAWWGMSFPTVSLFCVCCHMADSNVFLLVYLCDRIL